MNIWSDSMYVLTNISFMDLAIVCFITAACIITMIGIIIFTSKSSSAKEEQLEEESIDKKEKVIDEVIEKPQEKKEVVKESIPSSKREIMNEKKQIENQRKPEIKETKTKIQDVLTQIEHELENGEREKGHSFEELQEEKAIISYKELLKVAGKLKEENENRGDVLEKRSIPKTNHEEAYNIEKRNRKKEELARLALAKKAKMEKMRKLAALENQKVPGSMLENDKIHEDKKRVPVQNQKMEEMEKHIDERKRQREEMMKLALERKAKIERRNMLTEERKENEERLYRSKGDLVREEKRNKDDTYVPKKEDIPYLNFDKKLKREGNPDLMFERSLKKERMPNFAFEKEMEEVPLGEEKPPKEEKKFKTSDFISPIYGRMTNEEIRRSNDHFLDELKDLRKNLE